MAIQQITSKRIIKHDTKNPNFDPADDVRQAAARAFTRLHEAQSQLEAVFEGMATAQDEELDRLLHQQTDIEATIESMGGYAVDHKIEATLHGLGFVDEQFGCCRVRVRSKSASWSQIPRDLLRI